jgi:HD-GYP domain-containing protein (c-di-GMP phosphodiesterase class II)
MAHVLIWGTAREMMAGELPAGLAEEVHTFGALRAALDGRGPALVLLEPRCLDGEREAVDAWLRQGGDAHALLVAVADPDDGDGVLQRFPFVHDVLARPVSAARLQGKLERALDVVRNRRVIRQLDMALTRKGEELSELNKIGVALSAERDIDKLLDQILQKSREITAADAGSLYLVERAREHEDTPDDRLRFKRPQNDSLPVQDFKEYTIPLDESSIAGFAALTGVPVNVGDAYRLPPDTPYRVSRAFDEQSGYRTKSMLVVPMRDHENAVIGVVQLINKKRRRDTILRPVSMVEEEVIPFTSVDEELAGSLASQAAVAYENAKLLEDIRDLFHSFVHAAVSAIEQRDEPTRGHSERVAVLTVGLARKVSEVPRGILAPVRFTDDQIRELEYAALLHDFGKVAVREKVLLKEKKLLRRELDAIRHRFAFIRQRLENQLLRAKLERALAGRADPAELAALDREYEQKRHEMEVLLDAVFKANETSVVRDEESFRALRDLSARSFPDWDAEQDFSLEEWADAALAERPQDRQLLSATELGALSIPKGSLTDEERLQIQSHVEETYKFLSRIPWTGEFRRIPEIAYAHHEKLDGTGYPRRLRAEDIPTQARIMTISDVYDALVAQDRPYKPAVSPERALDILKTEMKGKVDDDLLSVFIDARVWDLPAFKSLIKRTRRR